MATNIYDFANAASLGLVNRFSPTQNIGFAIDAAQGNNLWDSWLGNSGIVSDKFMQEHPWWSLAINGVSDAGIYSFKNFVTGAKNINPYVRAYKNTRNNRKYVPHEELLTTVFDDAYRKELKEGGVKGFIGIPEGEKIPVKVMKKDNAQFAVRENPDAIGVEIHLGGNNGSKPSTIGQKFAFRQFENLPSGTYISPSSLNPSLEGVMQDRGFWKTLFSREYNPFIGPNKVHNNTVHLTENSYELLLNMAKRNPSKFRLDFAHNYRGKLHMDPASVDKSKHFYQLYHKALDTKDLTELNKYLVDMGAPKATFDKLGEIEFSLPILYKKRFGGKLN